MHIDSSCYDLDDIIVLRYEMNSKIQELMFDSKIFSKNSSGDIITTKIALEKFAQSIIQDILNKITLEQDCAEQNWQCKNGVHIVHELEKYLGV